MTAPTALRNPPPGPRPASRPTRWALEPASLLGYPLAPAATDSVETEVRFPALGWSVHPGSGGSPGASAEAVTDVYLALTHRWGRADEGAATIAFSRYRLIDRLGWIGGKGDRKPSGRHYRRLHAALDYLTTTRFVIARPDQRELNLTGGPRMPASGWAVLSGWRGREGRATATLTRPFRALLEGGEGGRARIDWDTYRALPPGASRQLYRTLVHLRRAGRHRLSLAELFQRVGSRQRRFLPSRARALLSRAHAELADHGLLVDEPAYEKRGGTWCVRYALGDPRCAADEEALLAAQAETYGVSASMARRLVEEHPEQLARVLAAVTIGLVEPKQTLPGMVVDYTRGGYDLEDYGRRIGDGGQLLVALESPGMTYLRWAAAERRERLARRGDLDEASVRQRVRRDRRARGGRTDPDWVIDGLVAMRLHQRLGVPGLVRWLESRDRFLG